MVKDLVDVDLDDVLDAEETSPPARVPIFRQPSNAAISREDLLALAGGPNRLAQNIDRDYRPQMALFLDRLLQEPGRTWQQRWEASGAERATKIGGWADTFPGLHAASVAHSRSGPGRMITILLRADVFRPSLEFLALNSRIDLSGLPWSTRGLDEALERFEQRSHLIDTPAPRRGLLAIQAATGKHLDEIVVEELVVLGRSLTKYRRAQAANAWEVLKLMGIAPTDAPSLRQLTRAPRRDAASMVDFYQVEPPAIREMFLRYLRGREATVDYSTLRNLAYELLKNFWSKIREHNPAQENLHLSPELAHWWKVENARDRVDVHRTLFMVRGLYNDIAAWATQDAYWAGWAAPSFLTKNDTAGHMKNKRRIQAAMHQRIRHFIDRVPQLLDAIDTDKEKQTALLAIALETPMGEQFEFRGARYTRLARPLPGPATKVWIRDEDTGEQIPQARIEHLSFWAWATTHILHETGVRMEELTELTTTALFTFQPRDGDRVLLLQIVPSKSDRERVLLVSPELAHVLASVRHRVRGDADKVPLAVRYDPQDKVFSEKLPFLFQLPGRGTNRVMAYATIYTFIQYAQDIAGIASDGTRLTAHDFRRIFATDALRTGLPVHILAKVMGHQNLTTTQGYTAVFDEDVARHFREFVDRRRALRPVEDYRRPSGEELDEFQQHFAKRKVELGSCSRGYGTPCIHEHACIRCPMLRPDPAQRRRLESIRANLLERRGEATRMGWRGELEGIEISLRAADEKLAQMSRIVRLTLERRRPD